MHLCILCHPALHHQPNVSRSRSVPPWFPSPTHLPLAHHRSAHNVHAGVHRVLLQREVKTQALKVGLHPPYRPFIHCRGKEVGSTWRRGWHHTEVHGQPGASPGSWQVLQGNDKLDAAPPVFFIQTHMESCVLGRAPPSPAQTQLRPPCGHTSAVPIPLTAAHAAIPLPLLCYTPTTPPLPRALPPPRPPHLSYRPCPAKAGHRRAGSSARRAGE